MSLTMFIYVLVIQSNTGTLTFSLGYTFIEFVLKFLSFNTRIVSPETGDDDIFILIL